MQFDERLVVAARQLDLSDVALKTGCAANLVERSVILIR